MCQPGSAKEDIKDCERKTGKKCKKFARQRTIKWKNGINPGKGKASKISSKLSDEEIKDKLNKLGFYKNDFSTSEVTETTQSKTKVVKKESNNSNLSLSEEIKQLNELYKDGALTKEEFKAAKAKLLNPSE